MTLLRASIERPGHPGTATVSELAVHWSVCDATVRKILAAAGLRDVAQSGWPKYRWDDVWRLEGAGFVPPCDWADFRAPLLRVSELPGLDERGRAGRTWRRHVKTGRMPSIELAPGVRRVRECVFQRMSAHV